MSQPMIVDSCSGDRFARAGTRLRPVAAVRGARQVPAWLLNVAAARS
ncbi:hypothetical protein [Actinoplanes sp. ATCC 53533]|nr:hypothetical protein [Actinoplanes sp. ATCC 53533]